MKKTVLVMAVALLAVPVMAQEVSVDRPAQDAVAFEGHNPQGHAAFAKAHKEQMAKMKAKQEKMSKLVKEYKGLKDEKKKEAKRGEIEKEIGNIQEEQLKFKKEQLGKFEERLGAMKQEFAKEQTPEGKKDWIKQKTDAFIENDGDMRTLFSPKGAEMKGPRHGNHKFMKRGKGFRMGKFRGEDRPERPGAGDDLTVQRPVKK